MACAARLDEVLLGSLDRLLSPAWRPACPMGVHYRRQQQMRGEGDSGGGVFVDRPLPGRVPPHVCSVLTEAWPGELDARYRYCILKRYHCKLPKRVFIHCLAVKLTAASQPASQPALKLQSKHYRQGQTLPPRPGVLFPLPLKLKLGLKLKNCRQQTKTETETADLT